MNELGKQATTRLDIIDTVDVELDNLRRSILLLQILAVVIILATVGHPYIALSPRTLAAYSTMDKIDGSFPASDSPSITCIVTFLLIIYIMICKGCMASVNWVRDELQNLSQEHLPDYSVTCLRMRARLVLRSFAEACNLPFVPGRWGPGIYLFVNIIITVVTFVVLHCMTL